MDRSYFDGNPFQLLGWLIVGFFITFFTLGICFPWALVLIIKWQARHTVIDGRRLYFDGTGAELLGSWILWMLLTIITLGIYGFWVSTEIIKWVTKHTHFEEQHNFEQRKSYFDGNPFQLLGWSILGFFITLFTLGICYPWALVLIIKWQTRHTVIDGRRLNFEGTGAELLGNWILWFFLTIITFGIYSFWLTTAVLKWVTKHTHTEIMTSQDHHVAPTQQTASLSANQPIPERKTNVTSFQQTNSMAAKDIYYIPCPACGSKNPQDAKFCAFCGTDFQSKQQCKKCGAAMSDDEKFCPNCGHHKEKKDESPTIAEMKTENHCLECKGLIKEGDKFCFSCGTKVELPNDTKEKQKTSDELKLKKEIHCEQCKAIVEKGESFCPNCGHKTIEKNMEKPVPKKVQKKEKSNESKEECSDGTWSISVSDDWVYFRNINDGSMYRIRHDGSGREMLKGPIEEDE